VGVSVTLLQRCASCQCSCHNWHLYNVSPFCGGYQIAHVRHVCSVSSCVREVQMKSQIF